MNSLVNKGQLTRPKNPEQWIDLVEQDFVDISNMTGRIFEYGVVRSSSSISSDVCPTADSSSDAMSGKHVWLNASSGRELSDKIRHFQSAYAQKPMSTSACVLVRGSFDVDLPLLKDFRVLLTVPKTGPVRQLREDGTWTTVKNPEKLRVFYLAPVADEESAEAGGILAALRKAKKKDATPFTESVSMMFSGRVAAAQANILFDSGASCNFVSAKFARQTGISVEPVSQAVRLADDETVVEVQGESRVFVQMGTFHKPVRCYVMDLMFEVDLILGDEFMTKYNCILHYGKKCVMIQKGGRYMTLKSPPLPRTSRLESDDNDADAPMLSCTQLKRAVRRGARVYLATLKPLDNGTFAGLDNSFNAAAPSSSAPSLNAVPTQSDQPISDRKWVVDLVDEFSDVFVDPLPVGLPPDRLERHSIPTEPGCPPPYRPMYRLSPLEYRELEKQVSKFLKDGILEVSTSPYGAPVLFVPKPNGRGLRLCVDYRALNSITVKNRCTIPRIDDLLDAVSGAKYFTSLDLTSGYHQILISEEDRPKTAFRTPFGHFQFKVLIEGLTNAPATFQTVMNSIFAPYLRQFVVVYLDDILIYSKTEAEHQAHLQLVLEILRREKFYAAKAKSRFCQTEIRYLGHIVSAKGIQPDPQKVEAVQNWKVPTNVHEVRSFLGLVNYFRKFIDHYSSIAIPLTNLTKKSVAWNWTGRCQDAFEKLKDCLVKAPLLRSPDESKPYEVVTDASDYGLGAVLLQEGLPIAFESRKLNSAELNYTVTEKEMLAVVHALRVWRCYLEGAEFTVFTDHVSNTFFQTQPNLSRRQARWSEFLQRFGGFTWEYRKGERNVADALSRTDAPASSRRNVVPGQEIPVGEPVVAAVHRHETSQSVGSTVGLPETESGDHNRAQYPTFDLSVSLLKRLTEESRDLVAEVRRDATRAKSSQLSATSEGLVLKRGSHIVVPSVKGSDLKTQILAEYHDTPYSGHYGIDKTRRAVGRVFWWPSLAEDVTKYVSFCVLCQRNKSRRHKPFGTLQPIAVPDQPWQTISFDFIVKLPVTKRGNDSICVFVDKLTKMVHFVACRESMSAPEFAELYVDNVFRLHGLSEKFITDRDVRFTSGFWKGVTELIGTKHAMSSSFHPQTDGQTERVNQTLEAYLRHFVSSGLDDWDTLLSRAEFAHNTAYHVSVGQTPFFLNHGFHPRTPPAEKRIDSHPDSAAFVERLKDALTFARQCLVAAQQRQKAFADQHRQEQVFQVGDMVLLSTKYLKLKHSEGRKLLPKWVGPFKVVRAVGPVAYELEMNPGWKVHPVFHVSLLEPYRTDGRVQPPPPPVELEGALEYEVESILSHRFRGRRRPRASYLVSWKGYGPEHNSWEPEENVVNAPESVAEYWRKQAERQEGLGASFLRSKFVRALQVCSPRHRQSWLSLIRVTYESTQ